MRESLDISAIILMEGERGPDEGDRMGGRVWMEGLGRHTGGGGKTRGTRHIYMKNSWGGGIRGRTFPMLTLSMNIKQSKELYLLIFLVY